MTTISDVIESINNLYKDSSNSIWGETQKLEAMNSAIDKAWPHIVEVDVDGTVTLASATVEYAPTATPETEEGYAIPYVVSTVDDEPKILLRGVTQRQDGAVFTIILKKRDTVRYSGKVLHLQYRKRLERVSSADGTVALPHAYLQDAAIFELITAKIFTAPSNDVKVFGEMLPEIRQRVDNYLLRNRNGRIGNMIPIVSDVGTLSGVDPNRGEYNA
jgi:hypothetical protein